MKVTKKLKKVLCSGLAGCLILGCLAGCGDDKETPVSGMASVPMKPSGSDEAPPEKVVFSGPEDKNCTSYVIPAGVTEIGEGAFSGCSALKTVKVPEGTDVSRCGLGKDVQVIYY